MYSQVITVETSGRSTIDITENVKDLIEQARVDTGLCHVFVQHTSASLIICENADPQVQADLERFLQRLAPDGDPALLHQCEGPDDMPAHIRSILTHTELTLPIRNGRPALGTWQGIYLYEHRTHPHQRRIVVSVWD